MGILCGRWAVEMNSGWQVQSLWVVREAYFLEIIFGLGVSFVTRPC